MTRMEPTRVAPKVLPALLPRIGVPMEYEITVRAFGLAPEAADAMFDRVSEAAHALDEETFVVGGVAEAVS